jgi:5-methylthioadenosine/S-adenosylhomocysteine deaminase
MLYTARYIVTQNETREILENAALLVRGFVIEAIGPAAELKSQFSDEAVEDLGNAVIMPGLINAHTHIPMSFLRGYSDDKSLMDWLYKDIFPAEAKLTPEVVELATLLSCAELLRFGCTAFYDMYMLERSVFKAADKVGIRAVLGESVSSFFPSLDAKNIDEFFESFDANDELMKNHQLIRHALNPHAIYTTETAILQRCRKVANEKKLRLGIHMCETTVETAGSLEKNKQRPIAYCDSIGLLDENTTLIHMVDINEEDIATVAARGCATVHNPASNMKLSSGVSPIQQQLDAGIAVGLGTDGPASNNAQNMFREMYVAALLQKLDKKDPLQMPVQTVLDMATRGSAAALGWADTIGSLEKGKSADFCALSLSEPNMQPVHKVLSNVIYSATGMENKITVVAGKVLYEDGFYTSFDYATVLEEAGKLSDWLKNN